MAHASPHLLVTVDTEGDDEWVYRPRSTCENLREIPRLQRLCEGFGLRPTYLVTYDILDDARACRMLRELVERGIAEVGAHLHPWRTPPFEERYDRCLAYPSELPTELLAAKLATLTDAVAQVMGRPPRSYRAGRYGLDARSLSLLEELGYAVDSSVTPWIDWRGREGVPGGAGGPCFVGAPTDPYHPSHADVRVPGSCALLEVPITLELEGPAAESLGRWYAHRAERDPLARLAEKLGLVRRLELRATLHPVAELRRLARRLVARRAPVLHFTTRSSELLPGASPYHADRAAVDRYLDDIRQLFTCATVELGARGATLSEFAGLHAAAAPLTASAEGR